MKPGIRRISDSDSIFAKRISTIPVPPTVELAKFQFAVYLHFRKSANEPLSEIARWYSSLGHGFIAGPGGGVGYKFHLMISSRRSGPIGEIRFL